MPIGHSVRMQAGDFPEDGSIRPGCRRTARHGRLTGPARPDAECSLCVRFDLSGRRALCSGGREAVVGIPTAATSRPALRSWARSRSHRRRCLSIKHRREGPARDCAEHSVLSTRRGNRRWIDPGVSSRSERQCVAAAWSGKRAPRPASCPRDDVKRELAESMERTDARTADWPPSPARSG